MILARSEPVEARVGAVMVVVVAPCRNQKAGMAQVGKQVLVEALVTQTTIEAFHQASR